MTTGDTVPPAEPSVAFQAALHPGTPALRSYMCDPDRVDSGLERLGFSAATYGPLFAYMHRRFGQPHMPGDGYKLMCPGWLLTTPDPGVALLVQPNPNALFMNFRPLANATPEEEGTEAMDTRVFAAVEATARDLLRPVAVRDGAINALGIVPEEFPLWERNGLMADYASTSGTPIPLGVFGTEAWHRLMRTAAFMGGDGGHAAGLEDIAHRMHLRAVTSLLAKPVMVQALVHGAVRHAMPCPAPEVPDWRRDLEAAATASAEVSGAADRIAMGLRAADMQEKAPEAFQAAEQLPADDDPAVDEARRYLRLLGVPCRDIGNQILDARASAGMQVCWRELVQAAGTDSGGDMPEAVGRWFAGFGIWSAMLPSAEEIAARFEAAAAPSLAAWARAWADRGRGYYGHSKLHSAMILASDFLPALKCGGSR